MAMPNKPQRRGFHQLERQCLTQHPATCPCSLTDNLRRKRTPDSVSMHPREAAGRFVPSSCIRDTLALELHFFYVVSSSPGG
jgi:hypothetical protein